MKLGLASVWKPSGESLGGVGPQNLPFQSAWEFSTCSISKLGWFTSFLGSKKGHHTETELRADTSSGTLQPRIPGIIRLSPKLRKHGAQMESNFLQGTLPGAAMQTHFEPEMWYQGGSGVLAAGICTLEPKVLYNKTHNPLGTPASKVPLHVPLAPPHLLSSGEEGLKLQFHCQGTWWEVYNIS